MAKEQLIGYVRRELKKGLSEEQIRQALVRARWTTSDIDEAFKSVKPIPKNIKPQKPEPEQALKETIKEETKKEEITVKTKESWFNRKKLIFGIIGLLALIVVYYAYEFIRSLK